MLGLRLVLGLGGLLDRLASRLDACSARPRACRARLVVLRRLELLQAVGRPAVRLVLNWLRPVTICCSSCEFRFCCAVPTSVFSLSAIAFASFLYSSLSPPSSPPHAASGRATASRASSASRRTKVSRVSTRISPQSFDQERIRRLSMPVPGRTESLEWHACDVRQAAEVAGLDAEPDTVNSRSPTTTDALDLGPGSSPSRARSGRTSPMPGRGRPGSPTAPRRTASSVPNSSSGMTASLRGSQ